MLPKVENNSQLETTYCLTADMFNAWINYIDASPKTVETYTRAVRQFYKFTIERGTRNPQREDVIAFRENLRDRGLKATTIQNYITAVRIFFNWTESEGLYPNIADHVKGAKISNEHKRDYLTASQLHNVLDEIETDSIKGLRDFAMVLLMATSALRTIEVSRANIEDLQTLGGFTVLYVQGKGKQEKADYVKVPQRTEKAIRLYLKARGEHEGSAPLFASTSNNNNGHRMTTRSISGMVKNRLQAAGYDSARITAHSLRHTAVTIASLSGQDIKEVQQFARHANIATTLIYDHSISKSKNKCADAVADAIFG